MGSRTTAILVHVFFLPLSKRILQPDRLLLLHGSVYDVERIESAHPDASAPRGIQPFFLPPQSRVRIWIVLATISVHVLGGGAPETEFARLNILQIKEPLLAAGAITQAEFDAYYALLEDPSFAFQYYLLVSAWGQRPTV